MGSASPPGDEARRRWPLPLARLSLRARNAKTPHERHLAACTLWEASLKLLASVVIMEWLSARGARAGETAGRGIPDHPSLGQWLKLARRLLAALAEKGPDPGRFRPARAFLQGEARDDLPAAARLDSILREVLEGESGERRSVRTGELLDRLVRYRDRELGPGRRAAGERGADFHERLARALLAGAGEVLGALDVLLGRRLVYIGEVRRRASGSWLVERHDLSGELPRRIESVEVAGGRAARLPRPEEVVIEAGAKPEGTPDPAWLSLHPLAWYDREAGDFFFLNARRGPARLEYLSYSSGRVVERGAPGAAPPPSPAPAAPADAGEPQALVEGSPASPRRGVGEFELVSRIGRGKRGVVYRAWQLSLGRQVTLKCLPATGDPKIEARLAREIRSLGRVDHPNLGKIYTSGSDGEQWFYATELVEGADLGSVIDRLGGASAAEVSEEAWVSALSTACLEARRREEPLGRPALTAEPPGEPRLPEPARAAAPGSAHRTGGDPIGRAVSVVRQAAEAAHALHEAGVLHREIKPGNIMLTADGSRAVLMDLGVAQLADDVEGRLTRTHELADSLRYASPEQVLAAGDLDARSDVYSLGATLWELLTLKPLFGAGAEMPTPDVMLGTQRSEPGRVRGWNPRVSPDLEAVVHKCLDKDRARRYGTARELAEDLARCERGEAVQARPPALWDLLRRRLRRRRWRFAAAAALLLASLLATAAAVLMIEAERRAARTVLFDMYTQNGIKAGDAGNPAQAVLWFSSAVGMAAHDPEREEANRVRIRTWSREAAVPVRALPHPAQSIWNLEFHPSDAYLLTLARGDRATVWDLKEEKPLGLPGGERPVKLATFSPGGDEAVLVSPEGVVELFRFPSGERQESPGACGDVRDVAFSPDGRFLAVAAGKVRLFDLRARRTVRDLDPESPAVFLAFNGPGDRLVALAEDSSASVFSLPRDGLPGTLLATTPGIIVENSPPGSPERQRYPLRPVFVDGDRSFLTLSGESELTAWETETGMPTRSFPNTFWISQFQVSADKRYLALSVWNTVTLWDLVYGQPLGPPLEHADSVTSVAFSPDGAFVLTCGWDRRALLWSLFDKAPVAPPVARSDAKLALEVHHSGGVTAGAFDTHRQFFATAHWDGLVRVWRHPQRNPAHHSIGGGMLSTRVALSPDGLHLLAIGQSDSFLVQTRAHEVATGKAAGPVLNAGGLLTGGTFYRDGSHAVTLSSRAVSPSQRATEAYSPASTAGQVRFWDWKEGKEFLAPLETPSEPWDCAFSPIGETLVVVCAGGQVLLVDPASGRARRTLDPGAPAEGADIPSPGMVDFSPDGRSFVTSGIGRSARVWETASGQARPPLPELGGTCLVARFSGDGRRLATGSEDGKVVVWDFVAGRPAGPILVHPGAVRNISFSPSGDQVLVSSVDVRLWEWESAKLICPAIEHRTEVGDARFSSDGQWIITAGRDGLARIWDGRTGMPVSPPLPLVGGGKQVLIASGGERVVVAGDSFRVSLFDLGDVVHRDAADAPGDLLRDWAQVISGQRIEGAGIVSLGTPAWLGLWGKRSGDPVRETGFDLSREKLIAWHRLQAEALEEEFDCDSSRWHLERLAALGEADAPGRLLDLDRFVRAWRFPPATAIWAQKRAFVAVDYEKLGVLEAQALSAALMRSRGPFIDLYFVFPERVTDVAAYAFRTIEADGPMKVKILTGSDDSLRVWVNRKPVIQVLTLRGATPDQDSAVVDLQAGTNTVLVEVGTDVGIWGFYFRLEDESGRRLRLTDEGRLEPIDLPR